MHKAGIRKQKLNIQHRRHLLNIMTGNTFTISQHELTLDTNIEWEQSQRQIKKSATEGGERGEGSFQWKFEQL